MIENRAITAEPLEAVMLPAGSFQGDTIIITGGGTGLGKSMAYTFLALGAHVVIASRKEDVLKAAAAELMERVNDPGISSPGTVLALVCDVRQYADLEMVRQKAVERFGSVTGLVNNAAGNFISPTERLSHKAFDVVVDIVLRGSYNASLAFGKYWIEQKIPGRILNIVTTYATTGSGYVVPSACGKGGVLALTRSLAAEWARYRIRVNAIAPGPFPTEGAWQRLFPTVLEKLGLSPETRIPLGRTGKHGELTNLAAYLMSGFSGFITGEVVTIDGGEWIYNAGEFNWLDKIPKAAWDDIERATRRKP